MGYWNQDWQNLRDKGCTCSMLNYQTDNRVDDKSCPYHHPKQETGHDMGGLHAEAMATFPQHTKRQQQEDTVGCDDYRDMKIADRGYPGLGHPPGDEGTTMSQNQIAGIGRSLPGILPSGDYTKPHQYVGPAGIIGGSCLFCGQVSGHPIHNFDPTPIKQDEVHVQAIEDKVAGDVIRIEITNAPTQEARDILTKILPQVLEAWLLKNKDYGDSDDLKSLGAKAEFVRLWNKMMKLKRSLWEGQELSGEQEAEIMGDMVAHLLLALNRA